MKLTFSMIGLNIIVFLLQVLGLVNNSFSFTPALFTAQPYGILTSMFLHSGINHLMLNMLGLFTFGSIVENEIGKKKWLMVYFFSGLMGSVGYMLLNDSPFIPAVGASGAIFGLMGAAAILKPKLIIWTPYGPFPMLIAAFIWTAAEFVGLFGLDTIAQSAHIFGIAGGIAITILLSKSEKWRYLAPLMVLPLIIAVVVSGSMPSEIPAYSPQMNSCYSLNDSVQEFDTKILQYSCGEDQVITMTKPSRQKFNLAFYNTSLTETTGWFYSTIFEKNCSLTGESIDLSNETAISTGKICDYKYESMAKICEKVEVTTVIFYKDMLPFKSIDCTYLQ